MNDFAEVFKKFS